MEFRQLRYFIAVAEEGNIGLAARRLNVSQPPVSRQIQALEAELDARLLQRTPKGVVLTAAGSVFLEDARRILAQADRAVDRSKAADRGEIGRLDVAFFGSPIYRAVPVALRAFQKAQPNTDISLTRMGKDAQITALRDGRIHIGFARYYPDTPGFRVEMLGEERLYAALSRDMGLARAADFSLADLQDLPLVLFPSGDRPSFADEVIGAYRNSGIEPKVDSIAEDATSALALTALGERCCIVPASVAALRFPALTFFPLADPPVRSPINCIYREHGISPVLKAFLATLRKTPLATPDHTESV